MGIGQRLKDLLGKGRKGADKEQQASLFRGRKSIGSKIAYGYAALAVFVTISGVVSLYQMNNMQKNTGNIIKNIIPELNKIHNVNYLTEHVMALSLQHILSTDNADKNALAEERSKFIGKVADTFKEYKANLKGEQEPEAITVARREMGRVPDCQQSGDPAQQLE